MGTSQWFGGRYIYLFWNYFDMRGKYSSLVYDTGRRGGERHREYD